MPLSFNREPGPGETRDCVDPWQFVMLRSNGDVSLCCRSQVLGNLKQTPVEEIVEGAEAVRMRERLLAGDLPHDCVICPERGVTSLAALRQRVEGVLFEETAAELKDLRRQLREHREQRAELLAERAAMAGHIRNLEAERAAHRNPGAPEDPPAQRRTAWQRLLRRLRGRPQT